MKNFFEKIGLKKDKIERKKEIEIEPKDEEKDVQNEVEIEAPEKKEEKVMPEELQMQVEETSSLEEDGNEEESISLFDKLKKGLSKTRKGITEKVEQIISQYQGIDEDLYEEIEEVLITSDIGMDTTMKIMDLMKERAKKEKIIDPKELKNILKEIIQAILEDDEDSEIVQSPSVILIVGVNGVGKTTTIGKLAAQFKSQGKSVLLAAGDTFRAAAVEQLSIWASRVGVDIIKHQQGSDPAAVIFDAIQAAKSRNVDILICDTAGRLHNKKNLMNELEKINRIINKDFPKENIDNLLVLDATTGQNAISQAKLFSEVVDINGLILTKLDGTSKGGVVLAIKDQLNIPVRFVGVGEGVNDLQTFDAKQFANALFE